MTDRSSTCESKKTPKPSIEKDPLLVDTCQVKTKLEKLSPTTTVEDRNNVTTDEPITKVESTEHRSDCTRTKVDRRRDRRDSSSYSAQPSSTDTDTVGGSTTQGPNVGPTVGQSLMFGWDNHVLPMDISSFNNAPRPCVIPYHVQDSIHRDSTTSSPSELSPASVHKRKSAAVDPTGMFSYVLSH